MSHHIKKRIVILLATFNGEQYLSEQIESIIHQEYANWILLIRDDGSSDNTLAIINKYIKLDSRIELLTDDKGATGAAEKNFMLLCEESLKRDFDYYFFSDQDDIWNADKIKIFISEAESRDLNKPLLLYSDLYMIDASGMLVKNSFMHYQGLSSQNSNQLETLLTQNYVTGCASMINKSLMKTVFPFPDKIIMHDWWFALCASVVGDIVFINKALVAYRQHAFNVVGAKSYWSSINPFKPNVIVRWVDGKKQFLSTIEQAGVLYNWMGHLNITKDISREKKLVRCYSLLLTESSYKRILKVFRLGIKRQRFIMQIAFLLRVFFISSQSSFNSAKKS